MNEVFGNGMWDLFPESMDVQTNYCPLMILCRNDVVWATFAPGWIGIWDIWVMIN